MTTGSRPARGEMFACLALMCAAAGVTLLAARGQRSAVDGEEVSGADTPAAAAFALVVFAAVGALLLLGAHGRRVVGVLLLLIGAATTAVMLSEPDGAAWFAYSAGEQDQSAVVVRSLWGWLGAAAGISLMITAAWMVLRAPRWPGRRWAGVGAEARPDGSGPATSTSAWDRIDQGEDPTV